MRLTWPSTAPELCARSLSCCRDHRPALARGGLVSQAGLVPGDGAFDCFGEVVQQVPAVGDLDGERCSAGSTFGVAAAAVPADHLDARAGIEPGAEGLRGPLGEHVHRPPLLDVDQDGAVNMAAAQREVIDLSGVDHDQLIVFAGGDVADASATSRSGLETVLLQDAAEPEEFPVGGGEPLLEILHDGAAGGGGPA